MQENQIKQVRQAFEILRAIRHQFRQKIIAFLFKNKNATVTDMYKHFHVTQSVMSQHLAILRNAGVVVFIRDKKFIKYHIDNDRLNSIVNFCKEISND